MLQSIFFAFYFFWKIFKGTKWRENAKVDLHTGRNKVDAQNWPEQKPRNVVERVWFWIA
jgi:amino acid transporter